MPRLLSSRIARVPTMNGLSDYRRLRLHRQIAILTDGCSTPFLAKTAINLLRYRADDVVGVIDRTAAGTTCQALLGAGDLRPVLADLPAAGSIDALYIGIAPPGGRLPENWRPVISAAIRQGLDVVAGLHDFLADDTDYRQLAARSGSQLIDIRRNHLRDTATGRAFPRSCVRIHTVGQDCSVGKMVVSLELARGLAAAGFDARFLATGQTGIMIAGEGIPIDCVVADFVNGAAEQLVQRNETADFVVVEGQGSLTHPAFSAVTLGLLHGCAPDGLIFCYEAGRAHVKGLDTIPLPPIREQMRAFEQLAALRHPCRFVGIAVNSRNLTAELAQSEIARIQDLTGLPACDVYRTGSECLVSACTSLRTELATP